MQLKGRFIIIKDAIAILLITTMFLLCKKAFMIGTSLYLKPF